MAGPTAVHLLGFLAPCAGWLRGASLFAGGLLGLEIVALNTQSGTGMTCPALCLCEALGGPLRAFTSWECPLTFLRPAQAHRRNQGPKTGIKSLFAEFGRVNRCPHRRDAAPAGAAGPRATGGLARRSPAARPMVPAPVPLPAPSEGGGTVRWSRRPGHFVQSRPPADGGGKFAEDLRARG